MIPYGGGGIKSASKTNLTVNNLTIEQNISARLLDDNDEYPYAIDFRILVPESNLPKVHKDSIEAFDANGVSIEYLFDNWILRFKTFPAKIKYQYDVESYDRPLEVTIEIKDEYLIVRPEITVSDEDVPEGEQGKDYSFEITVTGTGPFKWKITGGHLPNGLALNENNGKITGRPTETGYFQVTVTVSNSLYSVSITITIYIRPQSGNLLIIVPQIPDGIAGVFYQLTFTASGTGPFTWSLGGNYPSWISINPNTGILSGIPGSAGKFTFMIIVTDGGTGISDSYEITIVISDGTAATKPKITTSELKEGIINVSYYFKFSASGGGQIVWRLSGGNLPAGLNINTSGEISGKPGVLGTFKFKIIAENEEGYDEKEFTIIIKSGSGGDGNEDGIPPDIIAAFALRDGFIGVNYRVSLYAEGSRAISWNIISGGLPPGLTLNTDGTITGIPTTEGEYRFTVEAVNNWGKDIEIFVINIFAQEGSGGYETSRIIYETKRTIESLTEEELFMIPNDIYIIAAVMPRFRVNIAGTYQFIVNIYETVQTGLTLVWFPFAVNDSGEGTVRFLNSRNTEITTVPDNRSVIVSAYLNVGTYAPVIAVLRPDEPESHDVHPQKSGGGGGGGCNVLNPGIILLALILIRKR